jgi:hypothetical protein
MQALMQGIAERYQALPVFSPDASLAWKELAEMSRGRSETLRRKYEVFEVDTEQPYDSAGEMFRHLAKYKFRVTRANSDHPVWSVEDNVAFRICHDIDGHYAAHRAGATGDFSFEGELNAARWHERTIPSGWVRLALLTEVVGQAAYALHYGHFGLQKVAFLF